MEQVLSMQGKNLNFLFEASVGGVYHYQTSQSVFDCR